MDRRGARLATHLRRSGGPGVEVIDVLDDFAAAQSIVYVEIVKGAVTVTVGPNAWSVHCLNIGHTLVFDETEWTAFRLGATND